MKKLISVLAMLCITLGTVASATGFGEPLTFMKNAEPETLTPTGGMLIEESAINNTSKRTAIRMLSSGSQQTFEEYLREQLINHASVINVARFRIPVSEFADKYFAFIFCNSDLPIRAAYEGGVSFTQNNVEYMQSIHPVYIYGTKEECDIKYTQLDALTTNLALYASEGKTELEKALFLFDKISLDYHYTPGETFEKINYTPYSFLDKGHGVCQGYAILYKLALEKLGIESYLCGNYNPDINHAWNYIKVDGKWYHADPTWSYYSNAQDKVSRKYFLLSDTAMAADEKHGIKSEWKIQKSDLSPVDCTSNEYQSGYLFREFVGEPIYRDQASIYFSTVINNSLNLTLRNDTLKAPDVIMSEPDNNYKVYLLTLNAVNTSCYIIFASYGTGENMLRCSKLTADTLPEQVLIPLPEYIPEKDAAKIKCMLISTGSLAPITYYSGAEVAK